MSSEKFDINAFQEALEELISAGGPEDMAEAVARNPVLLREEADAAFEVLTNAAKDLGDEDSAKGLEWLRETVKRYNAPESIPGLKDQAG